MFSCRKLFLQSCLFLFCPKRVDPDLEKSDLVDGPTILCAAKPWTGAEGTLGARLLLPVPKAEAEAGGGGPDRWMHPPGQTCWQWCWAVGWKEGGSGWVHHHRCDLKWELQCLQPPCCS